MKTDPNDRRLRIFEGEVKDTFTIGFVIGKTRFRDRRFSPSLSFFEAEWLLENERKAAEREAALPAKVRFQKGREPLWH